MSCAWGQCPAVRWRTRLRAVTVITASRYDNLDSVIDKYQTGAFSTTYDSATDSISDCLNVDHVRRLMSRRLPSWLLQVYTVGDFFLGGGWV